MTIPQQELDRVLALADKATPGLRACYNGYGPLDDGFMRCHFIGVPPNADRVIWTERGSEDLCGKREDLEFVASLNPAFVAGLIRELAEARKVIERLPLLADGVRVVPGMAVWHSCGNMVDDSTAMFKPACYSGENPDKCGHYRFGEYEQRVVRYASRIIKWSDCYSTRESALSALASRGEGAKRE